MKRRISLFLCVLVAIACLLTAGAFAATFSPDSDGVYTVSLDAQPDNEYFMVVLKGVYDQTNYIEAYTAADDGDILYFEQKASDDDGVTFGPFVPNGYYASTVIVGGTNYDDPIIAGYLSVEGVSNTASINVYGVENSYTAIGIFGNDYSVNLSSEVLDSFGYPSVTVSEASYRLAGNLEGVSLDGNVITISKTAKAQTFQLIAEAGSASKVVFVDVKRQAPVAANVNFYSDDTYTEKVERYTVLGTAGNYPAVTVYAKTYDQYLDETSETYTYTYFGETVGATFTPKAGNTHVYLNGNSSGVYGSVEVVANTRADYQGTALELYNLINECKEKLAENKNISEDGKDVFPEETWIKQSNVDKFGAAIAAANSALNPYDPETDYSGDVTTLNNALNAYNASFKAGIRVDVTSVSIKDFDNIMIVGATRTLDANVNPKIGSGLSNDVLTWTSSDDSIVAIDSISGYGNVKAVVRGVSNGTATVTVTTRGGLTASAEITVIKKATDILISSNLNTAEFRGEPVVLEALIKPVGCTDVITWNVDKPDLADLVDYNEYVDENGFRNIEATVVPKGSGKITVKVKAEYGSLSKSKEITVKMPTWDTAAAPSADVESGSILAGTKVTLSSGTENTQIYYTLDGTVPSRTNGRLYKNPITVNQSLTLKAVAVGDVLYDSEVAVYEYDIVNTSVTVSSSVVRKGEETGVSVNVSGFENITDAVIELEFDSSVITSQDFICNEDCSVVAETVGDGIIRITYSNRNGAFSEGQLLYALFKADENAPEGSYAISVTKAQVVSTDESLGNLGEFDAATKDGAITVNNYIIGDANADGKVGLADVLIIKRYLAGNEDAAKNILLGAADVDADGDVDNDDVTLLSKYCVGWNVTLG